MVSKLLWTVTLGDGAEREGEEGRRPLARARSKVPVEEEGPGKDARKNVGEEEESQEGVTQQPSDTFTEVVAEAEVLAMGTDADGKAVAAGTSRVPLSIKNHSALTRRKGRRLKNTRTR